jgi:hypothetical protein
MKITLEISDDELRDIRKATGVRKKRAAVRQLIENALMLERRREMTEKFLSGEWGVEYQGYDEYIAAQEAECRATEQRWREEESENHRQQPVDRSDTQANSEARA